LLILVCVLGLTLISAGVACAIVKLDFGVVSGANMEFDGDTNTFFFNSAVVIPGPPAIVADFVITGVSGIPIPDPNTIGSFGLFSGLFTIGAITGTNPQNAPVTGSGAVTITDTVSTLVLGLDWLSIFTFDAIGGLNQAQRPT